MQSAIISYETVSQGKATQVCRLLFLPCQLYCSSGGGLFAQSYPTHCDPTNCSPSVSSNHRILQARILEWIAIRFSRGSSWPRDRTQVSCTEGRFFSLASGPLPPSSTPTPPRYTGSLYHLAIWLHSLFNPILHIPPHQAFRNSDIKVKNTLTAVRPVVLWICFLLLFLWNRPWDAPCTSLWPPSNTFSSCNPGISCSAILSSHDQPAPLSELSFFFFFFFFLA